MGGARKGYSVWTHIFLGLLVEYFQERLCDDAIQCRRHLHTISHHHTPELRGVTTGQDT